jgi:uncharacterized protein
MIQAFSDTSTFVSEKQKSTTFFTWLGMIIAMFSISTINEIFSLIFGSPLNNMQVLGKESLIFGMVAFLLFYIIPKENLNLNSIGLYNKHWQKSILWALILVVVGFALLLGCVELCKLLGWKFGESTSFNKLSPFTITFIVLRAGIAEEVFMRGYLLERLTTITGKKWMAFLISTIPFGLMHYSQGYAGIMIATVIGAMFAIFYFWKKDLKANIIAHFLIDFIPNILFVG